MVNGRERASLEEAGCLHTVSQVNLTPESLLIAVNNIARFET